MVEDKQNIKRKAFAISALMGNPKLAETIFESFSAPVGSTRNTKAKSILYSMKRANNIHDGQGGGGLGGWWQSHVVDPLQGVGQGIRSGIEDFSGKIQEPPGAQQLKESGDVGTTKIISGVDDLIGWTKSPTDVEGKSRLRTGAEWVGKGALGIPSKAGEVIGFAEKDVMYPWLNIMSTAGQRQLSFPYRVGGYLTDPTRGPFEKGKEYAWDPYRDIGKEPTKAIPQKKYYRVTGTDEVYDSKTHKHITAERAAKIPNFWDNVSEVLTKPTDLLKWDEIEDQRISSAEKKITSQEDSNKRYGDLLRTGIDPTAAAYETKWQTGFDPDIDLVNEELKKDPNFNPNFGKSTFDSVSQEDKDAIFDSMDSSMQDFYRDSYEASSLLDLAESAYELGLGSKTFAWTLLQDKEKLAAALGIPKEQAASLPEGLLSEQLNDLRDTIDKKYKIEGQLDKLFDLQQRDLTIEDDFKSYIRGKDEYLGDIDRLLDGAETKIASMDTSNPYVAQRMQMYVNYLTILQGRQNKRYIDFLDSGITKHKNDIDSATNVYNRSIEQANKEYQEIGTVTVESYNMLKTMLEDIYDNIESREDRQIKLEEYETRKSDAVLDSTYKVLRNAKLNAEIYGGTAGIEVNASTAKMFKDMYMVGENDDGTLNFSTYNPYDVASQASMAGQNSEYAMNSFMKDMGYTVSKSVGSGSLNQFEKFKNSMINNVANSIFDLDNLTEAEQKEYDKYSSEEREALVEINNRNQENLSTMNSKLQINLQAGLRDYFSSTEEKITKLREAIVKLSNIEGFGKYTGWEYGYPKEKFVGEFGETFGEFTEKLYDFTAWGVSEGISDLKKYPIEGKETFTSADFWASDKGKTGNELVNDFADVFAPYLMY